MSGCPSPLPYRQTGHDRADAIGSADVRREPGSSVRRDRVTGLATRGARVLTDEPDATPPRNDDALGREAAEAIVHDGLKTPYEERRTPAFARAAVGRLGELFGRQGLVRDMVEGAKQGAEALNVEAFHGVVEVVQNAEDQRATEVRIGISQDGPDQVLLLVHNGAPVEFHQLVAMSYAFLSTKREDAKATGRFGVGLKTLSRIARDLEIHCAPYHVDVETTGPRMMRAAADIPGFYRRSDRDTLLRLRLIRDFRWADFETWFGGLGSDVLLFLNSVHTLRLIDLRKGKPRVVASYQVRRSKAAALTLPRGSGTLAATRVTVRDAEGREWIRHSSLVPVPREQRRKNKATGETTEIAVAVQPGGTPGRLFAGLPLRVQPALPVAVNAQFDPDTARFTLQESEWNHWILKRVGDLLESIARWEAAHSPATCWRWIPLRDEGQVPGQAWLTGELEDVIETLQRTLARQLAVHIGRTQVRLADVSYEDEALGALVTPEDLRRLRPDKQPLAPTARDEERWRRVLTELGSAERIDVAAAVAMFSWPETRSPDWYVGLASAALAVGVSLAGHRCIIRDDGTPVVPPKPKSGEILVLDAAGSKAAVALGLAVAIHPVYSGSDPAATRIREWLEKHSVLRTTASGRDALTSLAQREQAVQVTDQQLLLLRDVLFTDLRADERRTLGAQVGSAILVDGFEFEPLSSRRAKPKRRKVLVMPAQAYLPGAIDGTGKRSWPTAAGTVPGLRWIDGRYRQLVSRADDLRGARALFTALGAAVTPRLVEREGPELKYNRPAFRRLLDAGRLQDEVVSGLSGWPTHVIDERVSPDLDLVIADLAAMPVRVRRERARALLTTIAEHWRNDYADHAEVQAVHSDYGWVPNGVVPPAWLSRLASQPWLSNGRDRAVAPMDLAIPTPRAVEVFGPDQSIYGSEFGAIQPRHYAALEAMEVTVEPKVSHILEALKDLRAQDPRGSRTTTMRAAGLYDILADQCAVIEGDVRPEDAIGDSTVQAVRAAFGIGKAKGKGLIVAEGAWWSPHVVFRGRQIFGSRRAFVPERRRADRLWEVLNVQRPNVRDCLDVLDEIGLQPLRDDDVGILIEIYRHLATLAPRGTGERDALSRAPLWSGTDWIRARPIFAVDDPQVTLALAEHEPVWQSPVPLGTLGELPARLGVTALDLRLFVAVGIDGPAIANGTRIVARYRNAVAHLRARFARRDATAFEHLRPGWRTLEDAKVAVTDRLGIEVRITGRPEFTVAVESHVQHASGGLVFAVASDESAGNEEAGGRAIASLFGDETTGRSIDREKIALAWSAAWADAGKGIEADHLVLAADDDDDEPDPLEGLEGDLGLAKAWRSGKSPLGKGPKRGAVLGSGLAPQPDGAEARPGEGSPQAPLAMRHLKRIEDLAIGEVTVHAGTKVTVRRGPKDERRGLADLPTAGRDGEQHKEAGGGLPRAYTDPEREAFAVAVLRQVLETDTRTLRDLRRVANLGADVVDNLGKYFEIKASAGDMPDAISLQYSQIERSLERPPGHWFLAVVAGLEQGYETKVRFIADPLRHLAWADKGSVTFTGVRTAKAIEITLPSLSADEGIG